MTRTRLLPLSLVAILLTGCGSGEDKGEAKEEPEASASPTAEASDSAPLSQQELQAKIMTNAAPKDLTWMDPKAPSHWRRLNTQEGVAQWQIGKEPCTVILDQPSGVGTEKEPSSEQVVEREIDRIAQSLKTTAEPKVVDEGSVMVPNRVVGLDGTTATRFAHARVDFGSGGEGDIRALRNGDFALIANAVCGQGRFADVFASDIEPLLKKLQAKTTY